MRYSNRTIFKKMGYLPIFVSILLLVLQSCGTQQSLPVTESSDEISFKFIQLNDVYEIAPLGGGLYGGLARVAHIRDSVVNVNPNTYMFMAGDFLNPSLLGTLKVDGERVNGKHMVEVMNAMNFDLVTFGNHEFDVGEKALQNRLNESNFIWTSANVKQITSKGKEVFMVKNDIGNIPIKETYILTIEDKEGDRVKVGFFSVTTPTNPVEFVAYGDVILEGVRAYNELIDKVDFVVGFTHLSLEEDKALANKLPDLQLIMGGHEHYGMLVPVNNTIIAKADANAKTIYIHTLTYNKKTKNLKIDSHLMPVDDKISSSPKVKALVDKWNDILDKNIKEVISDPNEIVFHAKPPLDGTDSANRGIQTNLGDIFTAAMATSFNIPAQAAIVNGGSFRLDDMLDGDISSLDVFRVLPFGGKVVKVKLKGSLLIEVLEYGKSKSGTGAYLQRHNIKESDIAGWMINSKPIRINDEYTIAMSDFLMKGYDIPFLKADNPGIIEVYEPIPSEAAFDVRKAVINYMKSLKPIKK
ncbi:bifunctional metallophosphatase/5'-nucleotidase [Ulvibacter antarcticus]|uniref:2',3'-cyclic-nucleotide 2'-phosphodiesterase (5'-nucleotidase family) n=1 Tax=Ulvibacter antarcticus TaxID=442714 RepID=A0A3L9YJD0_9FLAO|nr:5'-nucleotidase C-terminal domain-containing protein [Ulvibacter antarcticus]RMA58038.1 2',3'-cyclic-nucleotide 2'-phosphodiesterase (5'-nucleotidase family) [Ulvibacter antarcticus]